MAGLAALIRAALAEPLGSDLPFITCFPALIAAAIWGGFAGGLACLIACTAAAAWLFLPPGELPVWPLASFWVSGGLILVVGAAMADTVRELKSNRARLAKAQDELHTIVNELAHRNRNALAVIMSIVSQSARVAPSAAEAERIINARLDALARAQDVLVQNDGLAAPLRALLARTLEPFDLKRFTFAPSPDVEVPQDVATGLGLLIHELATNAVKYGALSAATGGVRLQWMMQGGAARLVWQEAGGPPVAAPKRKGFGTRLLDVALQPYGGRAERRFEVHGMVCELVVPLPGAA